MKRMLLAAVLMLLAAAPRAQDPLEQGFRNPPPQDRPDAFLDWMGGMISREGITKDLEALARQGVGGVMIMQLTDQLGGVVQWPYRDYPGKVACLSDEWFAMMNHAAGEADRLGLTLSTLMCPGWSHAGGPWIKAGQSLKVLVGAKTEVKGPGRFEGALARAPLSFEPKPTLPEWSRDKAAWDKLKASYGDYYRDVAVIAFPAAAGTKEKPIPAKGVVDLTGKMDAQGRLAWDAPAGSWTVLRLGLAAFNGPNYPCPVEGAGLECDRMDPAAVRAVFENYIGRIAREARAKGYKSVKGFDTDSYEAGFQDFSPELPAAFKKSHGYDCLPWLPAWLDRKLVIDSPDLTARFRRDMLATVSELWLKGFYAEIRRLADANGLQWMIEPYFKLTIDWRTIASRAHLAGSEFWVRDPAVNDIIRDLIGPAPDAAALYDKEIVWAEAYTARPDGSAWRNDPWKLKPYGDAAYCRGVNHFVMHGFVHNPFGDGVRPGLSMGFWGTQFSRNLTWWPYAADWTRYMARCQFLLRQGRPVADVLAYPPRTEHIPSPTLDCAPYKQNVLNDETLLERLTVRDGRLVLPGGGSYAALALTPPRMLAPVVLTPRALAKIAELVGEGATLIGAPPPARSASLENYPDCDQEMTRLIAGIWGGGQVPKQGKRTVGKGRVIWGRELGDVLNEAAGGPDCALAPEGSASAARWDFFHRSAPGAEIYFVANLGDAALNAVGRFRVAGRAPELWDAVTGKMRPLPEFRVQGRHTEIPLTLAPRQSCFVIFRGAENQRGEGQGQMSNVKKNFPELKNVAELAGAWEVAFDPKWGGPKSMRFDKLEDWTRSPELGIKYYSGTATYKKEFDLPQSAIQGRSPSGASGPQSAIYLDLGKVKNLARVRLNGKDLGVVWCAPWRVEIGGAAREKGNQLEIDVVNTWVNRILGDEQQPPDAEWVKWDRPQWRDGGYTTATTAMALKDLPDWLVQGKPRPSKGRYTFFNWQFYPKDAPLLESGLLGPVTVRGE